jgi:hypothetical protein
VAGSGRRFRGGPIKYPFKVGMVSDSDPKGSTGPARRGALALLAVARRKNSVGQKMDENQAAFSVRTEIHFRADGYRYREC